MSPITALDFRSELPQSQSSKEALIGALELAGLDPRKIHSDSARLRQVINLSRESIAADLGVPPAALEFVGELGFGFWLGIKGMLHASKASFIYSRIDRQLIHAFAREEIERNTRELEVNTEGKVDYQNIEIAHGAILSWQAANRETGVAQDFPKPSEVALFADLTSTFYLDRLPPNWSVALWDPRNFAGPEGLAILAISPDHEGNWRRPIPNIDNRRTFGSYSKSALIASAAALSEWKSSVTKQELHLVNLNKRTRDLLVEKVPGVRLAGNSLLSAVKSDPRRIAFTLDQVIAEELLRELEKESIFIDAGSACSGAALSPSHVLTAMGFSPDGQIRITLTKEHDESGINRLVDAIANAVKRIS